MRAVQVSQYGASDVLKLVELPLPEPGPGQVRVKLAAVGLNYIDTYQRSGQYKVALPFVPGQEGAGVIDAVGADIAEFQPGDSVAYVSVQGAYAEYALVPAAKLVPVPPHVDLQQAAAVILQGLTAHYLAYSSYPLRAGETALIHAAAGGTGLLLVQIAKKIGARVIGTVSTEEKAELARAAGADPVILYSQVDFETEVKRLTNGRGVDVVYDSVGKDTFERSLNCLRPRGYLVLFGQSSGAVAPFDPQILNAKGSLFLTRPTLAHYTQTRDELLNRCADLFGWLEQGELDVRIDRVFPLAEAPAAHDYLTSRQSKGKVLLVP